MTESAMSNKPILFSGEMVRAILEGRKTMTRRVMKPQPVKNESYSGGYCWPYAKNSTVGVGAPHIGGYCPYGNWEGGRLWVRESLRRIDGQAYYSADGEPLDCVWRWKRRSLPSIHMPRDLSRIALGIVNVSVERVQDVTDDDAEREGVNTTNASIPGYLRERFKTLWNGINATRGFGWDANPWVWVIEFRVLPGDVPVG